MSILNIGLQGLLAFQQALTTTSQNVANVDDPNYDEETTNFSSLSSGGQGNGVTATTERQFSSFADTSLINSTSAYNQNNTFLQQVTGLEAYLNNSQTDVATSLGSLSTALQSVIANPTSNSARTNYLNQAQSLANNFQAIQGQLNSQYQSVNSQMSSVAQDITTNAQSLASLNTEITNSNGSNLSLLDQRDSILSSLSQDVAITTQTQSDGSVNVFLSNGNALVVGGQASTVGTTEDAQQPSQLDVTLTTGSSTVQLSNTSLGGQMGGLINYRSQVINPALNAVGLVALGVANSNNVQNQQGMTLSGTLGGNIFNNINSTQAAAGRVVADTNNTGVGILNVTISNVANLTTSNYNLSVGAGNTYTLTRLSDNAVVSSGSLTGAFPQTISTTDGFNVNLTGGTFNSGDSYLITPTANEAGNFAVTLSDPSQLAVASPVLAQAGNNNQGTASISEGTVIDSSNASFSTIGPPTNQLNPPILINFTSPTSYQVINANTSAVIATNAYNPAISNEIFPTSAPADFDPGYRVELTGAAATGDQFTIGYNAGGVSDTRNGQLLDAVNSAPTLDGGTVNFADSFNQASNAVSAQVEFATTAQASSQAIMNQAQSQRNAISGVNLDQEAANLINYQNAYEASAKVISVIDTIFQSLITDLSS